VRITDLDAKSNLSTAPMKALAAHEREKKRKHLDPCLEQRRHFSPFIVFTRRFISNAPLRTCMTTAYFPTETK
jgi:hypothetical protein